MAVTYELYRLENGKTEFSVSSSYIEVYGYLKRPKHTRETISLEYQGIKTHAPMPVVAPPVSSLAIKLKPPTEPLSERTPIKRLIIITRLIYITSMITGLATILSVFLLNFPSAIIPPIGIAIMGAITLSEIIALSKIRKEK